MSETNNQEKHVCAFCGKEAHYYLPIKKIWCCSPRISKCPRSKKLKPGICPTCGKEHDGTCGKGIYCSKKCASAANLNKGRDSEKLKQHLADNSWRGSHSEVEYGRWQCNQCHEIFETKRELINHHKETNHKKSYEKGFDWIKDADKFNNSKQKRIKTIKRLLESGEITPSFLGKHHTHETRELLSKIRSERLLTTLSTGKRTDVKWYDCPNINGEQYSHQGTWELEVAKWLNSKNILWVKRKTINYRTEDGINKIYIPDFYLPDLNEYIEVKGFFPMSDKIKMNNVLKSNPGIKIYFICGKKMIKQISQNKIDLKDVKYYQIN